MIWKANIREQIKVATKLHAIDPKLKNLAKKMLDGDTEFQLLYSSSRQQYFNIKLTEKMTSKTGRIVLRNSNILIFKNFLKIGRVY